jgi:hypothetical protein
MVPVPLFDLKFLTEFAASPQGLQIGGTGGRTFDRLAARHAHGNRFCLRSTKAELMNDSTGSPR